MSPPGLLVLSGQTNLLSPGGPVGAELRELAKRVRPGIAPRRPELFLHVLDRFCKCAQGGVRFPAEALRKICFSLRAAPDDGCPVEMAPLATFDPLETVKELIDVLEAVDERCVQFIVSFTSYKLAGAGVFRGHRHDGPWQTIFAYCGGWGKQSSGKPVKCGNSPLFMGRNETCWECGKLICDKCGFCETPCRLNAERQNGAPALPPRPNQFTEVIAWLQATAR